jgi:hypothetical protein
MTYEELIKKFTEKKIKEIDCEISIESNKISHDEFCDFSGVFPFVVLFIKNTVENLDPHSKEIIEEFELIENKENSLFGYELNINTENIFSKNLLKSLPFFLIQTTLEYAQRVTENETGEKNKIELKYLSSEFNPEVFDVFDGRKIQFIEEEQKSVPTSQQ